MTFTITINWYIIVGLVHFALTGWAAWLLTRAYREHAEEYAGPITLFLVLSAVTAVTLFFAGTR